MHFWSEHYATKPLNRFLDSHLVLFLTNGKQWYDVHPLIREEVQNIIQRADALLPNT
jgi:hypothetical protein